MSGVGLIPLPMEPLSSSTCVSTHSSIIVPFSNPTDDNVLVDVLLTGLATTEEFLYGIQFKSDEDKVQLESSVARCLLSKERDTHTGIVTLIFNTIFAPYKPLRYVEPFTAHFLPGSGLEFEVSPRSGELLPIHSAGTLITVRFSPSMYSRKHRATLVIQVSK
ncbi:UNVERIFIED_CONTAM: hypothetical protein FKN15_029454 [Acipenser sinensis]